MRVVSVKINIIISLFLKKKFLVIWLIKKVNVLSNINNIVVHIYGKHVDLDRNNNIFRPGKRRSN